METELASSLPLPKQEKISPEELLEFKCDLERKRQDLTKVIGIMQVLLRKQVTLDLLKQTMIGKTVASFRNVSTVPKGEDEARVVRNLSNKLVETWKAMTSKERHSEKANRTQTDLTDNK